MKINGSTDAIRPDSTTGKPAAKAGAVPASRVGESPTVRLSGLSSTLAPGETGAEFDASRVAQIKEAIRGGRFEVDTGVVADKLIASVNDLFGRVH